MMVQLGFFHRTCELAPLNACVRVWVRVRIKLVKSIFDTSGCFTPVSTILNWNHMFSYSVRICLHCNALNLTCRFNICWTVWDCILFSDELLEWLHEAKEVSKHDEMCLKTTQKQQKRVTRHKKEGDHWSDNQNRKLWFARKQRCWAGQPVEEHD